MLNYPLISQGLTLFHNKLVIVSELSKTQQMKKSTKLNISHIYEEHYFTKKSYESKSSYNIYLEFKVKKIIIVYFLLNQ